MSCSEKQRLANIANAQRSTGPTSEAGKATSRGNAFRHGLAARVMASPLEDQDALDRSSDAWISELAPQGGFAACHAERAYRAYVRLTRCDFADDEALAVRVRNAFTDWDIRRAEKVRLAGEELATNPRVALAKLRSTAEGCLWLSAAWEQLEYRLHADAWTIEESTRAGMLQGLGEWIGNPWLALFRSFEMVEGLKADLTLKGLSIDSPLEDLAPLGAEMVAAVLRGKDLLATTRLDLASRIKEELEAWQALADELQPESDFFRGRSERLAMFDDSPEGQLRHRYQSEATRDMHRNLGQARQLSKTAPRSEQARPAAVKPPVPIAPTPPVPRVEAKPAAPAPIEPISARVVSMFVDVETVAIQAEMQAMADMNARNKSKPRPKLAV